MTQATQTAPKGGGLTRRQFLAIGKIADRLAPGAFEREVNVAILGALVLEAVVGADHGLDCLQGIG